MKTQGNYRLGTLIAGITAALASCLLALVAAQPAEATFPGTNGKIVFWSDRLSTAGGPGLYTVTPGGTATKVPGTFAGDNHAVWSPDGSRIAFQSTSATSKEISVMNVDGGGRRQLTATPSVAEQEPTWSPDGTRIAFAADTSGADTTTDLEIWAMNANGSGLTQLTNTVQGVRDTHPAWSPDGTRIAFLSEGRADDGNSNIYVMDTSPATDDALNLTPDDTTINPVYQFNDEDPTWSPDSTQIAYSTKVDVWKMPSDDPSSRAKTNLTGGDGGGVNPAWSPDGDSIVYARAGDIYAMDADGGNKRPIDTTLRKDEKPDWAPLDVTAPNVTSVSPTARRVSPKANVTAVFSEAMDPATLDGTTFRLVKKGSTKALSAQVTYSAAAAKATLNPARNLKSGATYKATVTTGAEDAAGNALAVNKTWAFKVR